MTTKKRTNLIKRTIYSNFSGTANILSGDTTSKIFDKGLAAFKSSSLRPAPSIKKTHSFKLPFIKKLK